MLSTDVIDLALNEDGDLAIPLRRTSGTEAVKQGIEIALRLFRTESFLDLTKGTPWLPGEGVEEEQAILGQPFDKARTIAALSEVIAGVTGVAEILSVNAEFDGSARALSVAYEVRAEFGDTVTDELDLPVNE